MLSPLSLTLRLTLSLSLLAASACATRVKTSQSYPPVADLTRQPKPVPTVDILTSAQAAAAYNTAIESWGEQADRAVGRLCTWAKDNGLRNAPC